MSDFLDLDTSPLIDGQAGVVQLQDDEVEFGRIDRADVTLRPFDTGFIAQFYLGGFAEKLSLNFVAVSLPLFPAFAILHLRVVEVGVMPMPVTVAVIRREVLLAVLHHSRYQIV